MFRGADYSLTDADMGDEEQSHESCQESVDVREIPLDEWRANSRSSKPYALCAIGRILNVVDFFREATELSLGLVDFERNLASYRGALVEVCRYALARSQADSLLEAFERTMCAWSASFHSESHLEWLESLRDIDEDESWAPPNRSEEFLDNTWAEIDEKQKSLIRLGIHLDRGWRRLYREPAKLVFRRLLTPQTPDSLLKVDIPRWIAETRAQCHLLQLSVPILDDVLKRTGTGKAMELIREIEQAITGALLVAEPATEEGSWEKGFLDLEINRQIRAVRRSAYSQFTVKLTPNQWQVFMFCFNAGDAGTTWDFCRGSYEGEYSARHAMLHELRERLKDLRVGIASRRLKLVPLD